MNMMPMWRTMTMGQTNGVLTMAHTVDGRTPAPPKKVLVEIIGTMTGKTADHSLGFLQTKTCDLGIYRENLSFPWVSANNICDYQKSQPYSLFFFLASWVSDKILRPSAVTACHSQLAPRAPRESSLATRAARVSGAGPISPKPRVRRSKEREVLDGGEARGIGDPRVGRRRGLVGSLFFGGEALRGQKREAKRTKVIPTWDPAGYLGSSWVSLATIQNGMVCGY